MHVLLQVIEAQQTLSRTTVMEKVLGPMNYPALIQVAFRYSFTIIKWRYAILLAQVEVNTS